MAKRTLESLNSKFFTIRDTDIALVWGISRDWKSLTPWTDNGRKLPFIGIDRTPYQSMNRFMILLGPLLVQVCWL